MKSMMLIPLITVGYLISDDGFARSLRTTADRLGRETTQIGYSLALFGLAMSAIYLMVGKQDAGTKITQCVLGVLALWASPSIINFVKTVA